MTAAKQSPKRKWKDRTRRCALSTEWSARLAPLAVDDLVRLGAAHDGGYVVSRGAVERAGRLLSFGVSDDWSFDAACLALNPSLRVTAFDHTVSPAFFRRRLAAALIRLALRKAGPGDVAAAFRAMRGYRRFFDGVRAVHRPCRIHNRHDRHYDATVGEIVAGDDTAEIVVKVDIEGAEYRIVDDLLEHAARIPLLIVEFHDTEPLRPVFADALDRLARTYSIIHMHANNYGGAAAEDGLPEVLEITFLRKDLCPADAPRRTVLPVPDLDAPNDPEQPDFALEFAAAP